MIFDRVCLGGNHFCGLEDHHALGVCLQFNIKKKKKEKGRVLLY